MFTWKMMEKWLTNLKDEIWPNLPRVSAFLSLPLRLKGSLQQALVSFLVLLHSSANGPPHAICRSKNLVPNSILGTATPAAVAHSSRRAVRVPEQTGEFVDCALNGSAFGLLLSCPPSPRGASRELLRSLPPRWLCLVGLACLTVLTVWTHGVELRLADVRAAAAWWAAASAASCPRQRACDGALACYGCRPEELSRCSSQRYTVCKFCSKMCFTDSLKW